MSVTILSKIIGFARDIVMASVLGATSYTDAYLVALTVPEMMMIVFASAFGIMFIPVFSRLKSSRGHESAVIFTNKVINLMAIMGLVLSLVGIAFARPLMSIFASGFEKETFDLTVSFARILFSGMVFMSVNYILTSYMQSNENFAIPAAMSIPYNIIIIASIFLSSKGTIETLVYGTLIAMFSQFAIQFAFMHRRDFKYKFIIDMGDENIKEMLLLALPLILSFGVIQIQVIVDRMLASNLSAGSITALSLASRLHNFAVEIFAISSLTVIYPLLAKNHAENDMGTLKYSISRSINVIVMLLTPIAAVTAIFHLPIIKLLFERGAFDSNATQMTSMALAFYSLSMLFSGLTETLTRIFYSIEDTKTPLLSATAAMIVNISLKFSLIGPLGIGGLALASGLASLFRTSLLAYSLRKKIGSFSGMNMTVVFSKVVVSSVAAGVISKAAFGHISRAVAPGFWGNALSLGASLALAAVIYLTLILVFKIDETNIIVNLFKNKVKEKVS